jgi:cytochrome b6-f complex iron-sulfur subunit
MNSTCGAECPIDRRRFITLSAYAAAATALAACAVTDGATAPTTLNASIKVGDFSALANVGGVATTNIGGSPVAIVRTGATTFITLSRICPHQGSTVNATSTGFKCPNHGATFSSTGTWTGGERTSSMRSYTTSYDAATGTLTVG